jgi:hypothetical protein
MRDTSYLLPKHVSSYYFARQTIIPIPGTKPKKKRYFLNSIVRLLPTVTGVGNGQDSLVGYPRIEAEDVEQLLEGHRAGHVGGQGTLGD